MERRREWREIGRVGEPERLWTLENNQTALKERGVGAWGKRLVCIRKRAGIAWSTGCGGKTMNTVILKRNKK